MDRVTPVGWEGAFHAVLANGTCSNVSLSPEETQKKKNNMI